MNNKVVNKQIPLETIVKVDVKIDFGHESVEML